jgi:hypothetical protein
MIKYTESPHQEFNNCAKAHTHNHLKARGRMGRAVSDFVLGFNTSLPNNFKAILPYNNDFDEWK